MIAGDPYYNPNLDYDYRTYDLSEVTNTKGVK